MRINNRENNKGKMYNIKVCHVLFMKLVKQEYQITIRFKYVKMYNLATQNRTHLQSNVVQLTVASRANYMGVEKNKLHDEIQQNNHNKFIFKTYYDFSNANDLTMDLHLLRWNVYQRLRIK